MNNSQAIIVYRSQMEKSIDQAIMSGEFLPVFGVLMVGVFVYCSLHSMLFDIKRKKRINSRWMNDGRISLYCLIASCIVVFIFGKWVLF
jgi:hypothetical protein